MLMGKKRPNISLRKKKIFQKYNFQVLNVKSLYARSKCLHKQKDIPVIPSEEDIDLNLAAQCFCLFSCKMHALSRTSYHSKMHSHAVSMTADVKRVNGKNKKIYNNNNIRHTSVTQDCTKFTSSSHKHECTTTCRTSFFMRCCRDWDTSRKKKQILSFMLV